jgi:hypothetical protein
MSAKIKQCPNCEYQLTPYHNYCPNCGQKVDDKLSMRLLFHNTIMNYFSVDARFFRSFIPLLTKPGYLAKQYVGGKRLLYLHPAQFYLFASIVFFFLFSMATRSTQREFDDTIKKSFVNNTEGIMADANRIKDSIAKGLEVKEAGMHGQDSLAVANVRNLLDNNAENDSTKTKTEKRKSISGQIFGFEFDSKLMDSLENSGAPMDVKLKAMGHKETDGWFSKFVRKQILKFRANRGVGILKAFLDTIPISMFFLIPIFAFLLKILYRKRGRFAHHMVFSFYYFAFMFLASSIILVSNYIVDIPDWIDFLLMAFTFFYLVISLKRFYEQGYIKTFIKTCILSFVYLIFVVPLTFVMLWIVSFVLY